MIKLKLMLILLVGITFPTFSQDIEIKINNTEPRLGQEINVTITLDFFEELFKSSLPENVELKKSFFFQDWQKKIVVNKLGPTTIGPVQFEFNGETYTSNVINLNVIPNLTDEEGVWIRKLNIDDKDFILIEQLSKQHPDTTQKPDGFSIEYKGKTDNLVEMIKQSEEYDIEFFNSTSGTGPHPNPELDNSISFSYTYKFYEIQKGDNFKESFQLSRDHFVNLPEEIEIPEIIIE